MDKRLSTGIEALDRQISGGIRAGSLVVLETPPESQGEIILREIARQRPTQYLSTTRTEEAVRRWFGIDADETEGVDVRYVGGDGLSARDMDMTPTEESADDEFTWADEDDQSVAAGTDGGTTRFDDDLADGQTDPIGAAVTAVESFGHEQGCVVVDPVNTLEQSDETTYKRFLHWLHRSVVNTESIAFLHAVEAPSPPDVRWLTMQLADEVWSLSVDAESEHVEFRLALTKSRGGTVPDRRIKLVLGDDVDIDTSRDIA